MALPKTEATTLDEETQPVALTGLGEIAVRGPQVMQGVWQTPKETAAEFTADQVADASPLATVGLQGQVHRRILQKGAAEIGYRQGLSELAAR